MPNGASHAIDACGDDDAASTSDTSKDLTVQLSSD